MCKCDPKIRTPYCRRGDCHPPVQHGVREEASIAYATPTWDETFFEMCDVVAKRSKDPSTKVGCMIVGPDNEVRSSGYNGFPIGVHSKIASRYERPQISGRHHIPETKTPAHAEALRRIYATFVGYYLF